MGADDCKNKTALTGTIQGTPLIFRPRCAMSVLYDRLSSAFSLRSRPSSRLRYHSRRMLWVTYYLGETEWPLAP